MFHPDLIDSNVNSQLRIATYRASLNDQPAFAKRALNRWLKLILFAPPTPDIIPSVMPEYAAQAFIGINNAKQHAQSGSLVRTIGPQNAVDRSLRCGDIDPVHRQCAVKSLDETSSFYGQPCAADFCYRCIARRGVIAYRHFHGSSVNCQGQTGATPSVVNTAANLRLKARIAEQAKSLGFAAFGVTTAQDDPIRADRLEQWLGDGHHGSMEWMEVRSDVRRGPQSLWPEAKSVIALGMSYAPADDPLALEAHPEKARISVYARGKDYHDTVKRRLKALARWMVEQEPENELKVFVDTAPVMEKPLGEAAGIGWQGKHTNLVSRDHGNWLFLGAIYTTLELEPDAPHEDRCGSCNACQTVCPTDAFPAPYTLDARRCISYLTIEHKGPIAEEFREALGNRIYGCDDCLAVCPWNKFAETAATHRDFLPRAELVAPRLAELLALDDAGFRRLFAGSPIKRIGRDRFVRNCLYAAGNSGDASLMARIGSLRNDPDLAVAEAADWATEKLTTAL